MLYGFQAIARLGVQHNSVKLSNDSKVKDLIFYAINTVMGNLKRHRLGIRHAIHSKLLQRYLAVFAWRFYHRLDLKNPLMQRLCS